MKLERKVFLGGTCNESTWREKFLCRLEVDAFNPVVEDWDDAARSRELRERERDEILLYCLTPRMTGVYAVAEVVDDSNKRPLRTILLVLEEDGGETFGEGMRRSVDAVLAMVEGNGCRTFTKIDACAEYCNAALRGGRPGPDAPGGP